MSFGPVLEVGIGLIFVFLVLALVTSALNEAVSGLVSRRASFFEKWLRQQLGDGQQVEAFFAHPLVRSMSGKRWVVVGRKIVRRERPSYLEPRVFASALLDTLLPKGERDPRQAPPDPVNDLANERVKGALSATTQVAGPQLDRVRREVERWFDDAMERVAGWYKRRTQLWLWVFAVIIAVGLNVDTLLIARTLWTAPATREVVAAQAEQFAEVNPQLQEDDLKKAVSRVRDLNQFQIPVGWARASSSCRAPGGATEAPGSPPCDPRAWPRTPGGAAQRVVGWLLSAAAMTLGAPFWFDLLRRVAGARASGRPAKASRAEGPEPVPA
jgi:hypothetical protein